LRASTENRIDKLQIARRELDFAILTQCRREESLAVHLLAFSAYTILFDLWKERTAITLSSSRWSGSWIGERNLVPSSTTFPTL
jgi:hypothetical protein